MWLWGGSPDRLTRDQGGLGGGLRGEQAAEGLTVGQDPAPPGLGNQHSLREHVVVASLAAVLPLALEGGPGGLGGAASCRGHQGPQLLKEAGQRNQEMFLWKDL